jgi:hypothetical protein
VAKRESPENFLRLWALEKHDVLKELGLQGSLAWRVTEVHQAALDHQE